MVIAGAVFFDDAVRSARNAMTPLLVVKETPGGVGAFPAEVLVVMAIVDVLGEALFLFGGAG